MKSRKGCSSFKLNQQEFSVRVIVAVESFCGKREKKKKRLGLSSAPSVCLFVHETFESPIELCVFLFYQEKRVVSSKSYGT